MSKCFAALFLTALFPSLAVSSDSSQELSQEKFSSGQVIYAPVTLPSKKRFVAAFSRDQANPSKELTKTKIKKIAGKRVANQSRRAPVAGKSLAEPGAVRSVATQSIQGTDDLANIVEKIIADTNQGLPNFHHLESHEIHQRALAYRMEPIRDFNKSFQCLLVAANEGYGPSFHALGLSYLHGMGTEQDNKKGFLYFRLGAEKGDAKSFFRLGYFYENGLKGVVAVNKDLAQSYYRQAGKLGFNAFAR